MSQSLSVSNAELLRSIAVVAGFSRDPDSWDATQLDDCRAVIRSGLRRFLHPAPVDGTYHQWRFLERPFTAIAPAGYSTGTIAVSGGVVLLTGGTFPTWAADGVLRIDGRSFFVTARTTGIELIIDHDAVEFDAGTSYELYRYRYALPTDFTEFIGQMVYDKGTGHGRMLRLVDEAEVRLRYASQFRAGDTCLASVSNRRSSDDASDFYLSVWPIADENAVIAGVYRRTPLDNLDSADLTADGSVIQIDAAHAETLIAAIQAAAEEFFLDTPGVHSQRFFERLAASIKIDQYSRGPAHSSHPKGIDPWRFYHLNHVPDYSNATL